jgi:hypothetical protein
MSTLPQTNLAWSAIQSEYGGSNPIGLNEYYGIDSGIPGSGAISASQFRGQTRDVYLSLGSYSHGSHAHSPSGNNGDKYFKNNSISHNHTVGSISVSKQMRLDKIYIRGNGSNNVDSYIDKIYVGGTLVWDGTTTELTTTGDGTNFETNHVFNSGNYSIRIDTYAQYESSDRLYISALKFFFREPSITGV